MIYIFLIIALIVMAIIANTKRWEWTGFLILMAVCGVFLGAGVAGFSYYNMTNITVYYDEVAAVYGDAIDEYNASVKDMLAAEGEVENSTTLTDFGQQGYQKVLGKLIIDQRYVIVDYNRKLGKKQIYKNNVFWNWLISMPPERCVPIKIAG